MFYQCPNCKRIWQYKIDKCPWCFIGLERKESKKLRVIGVSKVSIPSISHPKVPYFVLVLEDQNKNRFVFKSKKEFKIGDRFEIKKGEDKNGVALWRVKYDLYEAISKIISLLNLQIKQSSSVLILPTLVSVCHPHERENTHPEVLDELIKILKEKGAKNIKVAGQSHKETPLEAMAKKSQILSVCQKNEVEFFDLAKSNFKRIEKDGIVFEISEEVFKNDLVINLPIFKIAQEPSFKGASENLTKLWKKESFLGQKYLYGEEELILKLKGVLPEIFNLADATTIQISNQKIANLDLILGSYNSLNLDRVFAEITSSPLPQYLKGIELNQIPIFGREIDEIKCDVQAL